MLLTIKYSSLCATRTSFLFRLFLFRVQILHVASMIIARATRRTRATAITTVLHLDSLRVAFSPLFSLAASGFLRRRPLAPLDARDEWILANLQERDGRVEKNITTHAGITRRRWRRLRAAGDRERARKKKRQHERPRVARMAAGGSGKRVCRRRRHFAWLIEAAVAQANDR